MSSSTLCFLMAMTILMGLIPHSLSVSASARSLIGQVCRQTDDFFDCLDTFNEHVFTDPANAEGLTEVALFLTLDHASDTRMFIERLSRQEANTNMKDLYAICIAAYELLSADFQDASFAFARQDYRIVISDAENSVRFAKECESVLAGKVPQISVRNKHSTVLVQMTLFSARLIGKK